VAQLGTTVAYCRAERWVLLNTDLETIIMLITLAIVLIILWALGFLAFHVTSGLIHILLVIALIVIVARLVTGRRPVA
jgi:uncharacterized membrane protein (DUF485 family)